MELLDPYVSSQYAMQCIKWCAENGETTALEEHLKLHKDTLKDKFIPVLLDAFSKRQTGVIKTMFSTLDKEIRTAYSKDEKHSLHKLLCNATEMGDFDIVMDLIDKGANINIHFHGKPLLHIAACYGHLEIVTQCHGPIVRQVITLGANVLVKSSSGKLPIHLAAKNSPDVLVEIIRDAHDVNTLDEVNKETPLHMACGAACCKTISILIQSGCRFNMVNKDGQTPLAKLLRFTNKSHDFHTKTRLKIAKVLISIGFRMNQQSQKAPTAYNKGRDKSYDRYVSLKMSLNTPTRLQSLARLTVSESLTVTTSFQNEIDKLDIPVNLKSFVMFYDLRL